MPDINAETRALADQIGLAGVAESITEYADKDLPLIVDYAGFGTTTARAAQTLAPSGTVVQVGLGRPEAKVNGTRRDLAELYELMRGGELDPPIQLIAPDRIPEGLERLRQG
ncbi:hypothetical protein [Rhodococcus sp. LB1]|uniref:hypothetical protein n=1 Tax=Rhodococcus sp. LB1 TaxID=1807499 RepID=UPI001E4E97DD|nr:hypothetical protein [Rhodococcus sp. LB1]